MDEVILLGVKGGPAIRQGGAMPTASLLRMGGQNIVVDCAVGATRSVVEAGVSVTDIDAIFITHLHSDHLLELGPLIYTAWTTSMPKKVKIFGPIGIADYWKNFLASMSYDHAIRMDDEGRPDLNTQVEVVEFDASLDVSLGDVKVTALRVDHPPVTECYALRFEHSGKSVVFSADTCYFPPLAVFSKDADILVHEAMLLAGVDKIVNRTPDAKRLREHLLASHTAAGDVAKIATAANVKHLVLNHLIPVDDPEFGEADWREEMSHGWDGPLTIGHDGLSIPIK
ncbi:MBL fold metallo-hydrolase [Cognatishimia sp. SS12]|uniref:MBL fold metallo-hydrolase n=1 Tax=Cognatishimia sp. SS12 TaxID=2979465 RepID=UPI0023314E1A|nr:MBL fold metallo-hydrolase [Cognatishimia sp. SS12]MDC0739561.1 MBL fold metallo-hydrolase [Cognatishimia sp. SS12]